MKDVHRDKNPLKCCTLINIRTRRFGSSFSQILFSIPFAKKQKKKKYLNIISLSVFVVYGTTAESRDSN